MNRIYENEEKSEIVKNGFTSGYLDVFCPHCGCHIPNGRDLTSDEEEDWVEIYCVFCNKRFLAVWIATFSTRKE